MRITVTRVLQSSIFRETAVSISISNKYCVPFLNQKSLSLCQLTISMSTSRLPILYSHWKSSCAWRVRIALKYKNIPHEVRTLDLVGDKLTLKEGDQYGKKFEEINPIKYVPVLQIDNTTLIESLNILQYLEETRPEIPLLFDDAVRRAKVREICYIIAAGIQPLQNLRVQNYVGKDRSFEWTQHWICHGFTALEKLLAKTAKTYCVGDAITFADCCLIPQVYNARCRYNIDVDQYPTIVRIDSELNKHEAFADTCPSRQPDYPSDVRE